jgi:DNA primase
VRPDFAAIKEANDIRDVANRLELNLSGHGDMRAKCPRCESNNPRGISISVAKQNFYCHVSKKQGNVLDMVMHVRHCTLIEAAKWIQETAPHEAAARAPRRPALGSQPGPTNVQPTHGAMSPLELDSEHEEVAALGVPADVAAQLGIGYASKGTMRHRVLIPLRNGEGGIVGYCGIALDGEQPFLFPKNLRERFRQKNKDRRLY